MSHCNLSVAHKEPPPQDAHQLIVDELGFEPPEVGGYNIVVKLYLPDEMTAGGIYLPPTVSGMHKFQSCVGKVISMGPDAFQSERFLSGPWTKLGNWVAIPRAEGTQLDYRGIQIMIIPDDRILLTNLEDPTYVKRN